MRRLGRAMLGVLFVVCTSNVHGVDRMFVGAASGATDVGPGTAGDGYRLGVAWTAEEMWRLGLTAFQRSWELTGGAVRDGNAIRNGRLSDIGFSAVLRAPASRFQTNGGGLYVEGGFGIHRLFSKSLLDVESGSHWQFGTQIGMGIELPGGRFAVGYRLLHLSNASLDLPNPGFNFHIAHLTVRF